MNFYYIFTNGNNWIKLSGNGTNPAKCSNVKFTCNKGNEDLHYVLDPISDYVSSYGSVLNYVDHPRNLYIQANKFGYLSRSGYKFQENNFIPFDHNKTIIIKKSEKVMKLMVTAGLVQKKVLVRKKGSKPFWSTRWVQPGQDVKEVVRSLGYEVVEEKSEKRIPTGRVNLQGMGDLPSIEADEVRTGDIRLFNQGEENTIINIEQKTPKTLIFTYSSKDHKGENYKQNVRVSSKIVIKELYDEELKKDRERRKELNKKREAENKKRQEDAKKRVEERQKVVIVKPEVPVIRSGTDIKNEIITLKNKIYYAKKRDDLSVIPEIEKEIAVLEVELKAMEDVPRDLQDVKSDFILAKTMGEATERANKFIRQIPDENKLSFGEYGFDLNGLKLDNINSIINGFEKSFDKYGLKLDFIGWNKRKQRALAVHQKFANNSSIVFQKTATKGVKKAQKNNQNMFDANKIDTINKYNRYLSYEEISPGDNDRFRSKIAKMEVCKRWLVQDLTNDPLAVTACHEGQHAIYFEYKLESKWKDNLTYHVGDDMHNNIKCASVSEYGMSEIKELFAEVGAAVAFGIEINPDVKQAYLDTVRGINR